MKIEGDRPNIPVPSTDRTDRGADAASAPVRRQPRAAGETDGFTVSPELQLVQSAVQTAAGLPEIRQDLVERMRALLEKGEVGNDPQRLADALIDRWLTMP